MNCMPTVAIALLLLSLTGGMWLLYKTQKENLNAFFKVIAWLVIIVSLCSMICCGLRCCMRACMMKEECRMERMYGGDCGMGMNHGSMMRGCSMGQGMNQCPTNGGGCCNMDCCKMKGGMQCEEDDDDDDDGACDMKKDDGKCPMKMGVKKDSVVIKKK